MRLAFVLDGASALAAPSAAAPPPRFWPAGRRCDGCVAGAEPARCAHTGAANQSIALTAMHASVNILERTAGRDTLERVAAGRDGPSPFEASLIFFLQCDPRTGRVVQPLSHTCLRSSMSQFARLGNQKFEQNE
jgi:hypothetical protein